MGRRRQKKENNAGFSLVELLVSIAILAVVSAAIFEFVMVAIRNYQQGTREVEVQYEAQLVMNQLQDLLIDARRGVTYTYYTNSASEGTMILSDADIPEGTVKGKRVIVYHTDCYYVLDWVAEQQKILYSEYSKNEAGDWVVDPEAAGVLMAEYVQDFSADLSLVHRNNCIGFDLVFDNEREYRVTQNVKLRNQVSVNVSRTELYRD